MLFSEPQHYALIQTFTKPSIVRNQYFIWDYLRKMQHMDASQKIFWNILDAVVSIPDIKPQFIMLRKRQSVLVKLCCFVISCPKDKLKTCWLGDKSLQNNFCFVLSLYIIWKETYHIPLFMQLMFYGVKEMKKKNTISWCHIDRPASELIKLYFSPYSPRLFQKLCLRHRKQWYSI